MDICNEIEQAKVAVGNMAAAYARAATFGNSTEEALYAILQVNAMIKTLENNIPSYRKVKKPLQGEFVSLSSLKKENNKLILDSTHTCVEVEIRHCLSDIEICQLVENLRVVTNNVSC